MYLAVLAYFLFLSERYGRNAVNRNYGMNLELFHEIKRYIKYRQELGLESFIVNIFGNVLAFAPFGYVVPIISPHNRKLINVLFLTLSFSMIVENIQLIGNVGTYDVDDMFLNTLGGFVGYLGFYICNKMAHKKKWL